MKRRSYEKCLFIALLLLILFSSWGIAREEYIRDTTGKIDNETIQIINSRLEELEGEKQIKLLILVVNNTDGKNIDQYTLDKAKELETSKYAIFVTSIEGRKNHFLVGGGIRHYFTKEDIDKFSSISNDEFKKGEFSKGVDKAQATITYYLYRKIEAEQKEQEQQLKKERYERLQKQELSNKLEILCVIVFSILTFGSYIYIKKCSKSKNRIAGTTFNNRYRGSNNRNYDESRGSTYNTNNNEFDYRNNQTSDAFVSGVIIGDVIDSSNSAEDDSEGYGHFNEENNDSDSWDSDSSSNSSSSSWWSSSSSNDSDSSSNDSSSSSWWSSSSSDSSTSSWDSSSTSSWSSDSSSSSSSSSDSSSTSDW